MNVPHWAEKSFTKEGPASEEMKIIGVELAIRDAFGSEHELEMFSCEHTFLNCNAAMPNQLRITLHTNRGDITLRQDNGRGMWPGNYQIL